LSGRGLCDELITRPEESYRLCCVVVCDLETSRLGAPYIYDISRLRVNNALQDCGGHVTARDLLNISLYYGPCRTSGVQLEDFHDGVLASPQRSQCGVCDKESDTGAALFPSIPVFPYLYHSNSDPHLLFYERRLYFSVG